jgi:ABC-type dipeptide/oligopeptide/nickel transport system permease component
MLAYTLRRLAMAIPVVLGVATLVFSLIHLVPGDPAQAMLGETTWRASRSVTSGPPFGSARR